jgi:Leucine-rich repeat (LRR) protein
VQLQVLTGSHVIFLPQVLELPNNRFTVFPIDLHLMKGLKKLNLANNALSLLPRKIDVMTNLETLDLSR